MKPFADPADVKYIDGRHRRGHGCHFEMRDGRPFRVVELHPCQRCGEDLWVGGGKNGMPKRIVCSPCRRDRALSRRENAATEPEAWMTGEPER